MRGHTHHPVSQPGQCDSSYKNQWLRMATCTGALVSRRTRAPETCRWYTSRIRQVAWIKPYDSTRLLDAGSYFFTIFI